MFSEEALISMADGTFKPIGSIVKGDIILNKFKRTTKVLNKQTHNNQECFRVQFNNRTSSFHTSPESIVFCYYRTPDYTLKSQYCHLSHVYDNNGFIKADLKIFSPDSDVLIESYTLSDPVTLYSLYTSDNSQSYFVNKIITSNHPSCFN
jgi:hypothetical protein